MNYAAAKQYVNPQGAATAGGGTADMPWELDDVSAARQETWLLSFIDILALLLTLFVLLLAYQDNRPERSDEAATIVLEPTLTFSLQGLQTFTDRQALLPAAVADEHGFAMPGEGLLPMETAPAVAHSEVSADEAKEVSADPVANDESAPSFTEEAVLNDVLPASFESSEGTAAAMSVEPAFSAASVAQQPVDRVLEAVAASRLKDRVEVLVEPGAVSLEISDNILFAPASASLSAAGLALLDEVAELLRTLPYSLSVEGHTDNVPIRTARFPSNWELSSARAAAVTRQLIDQGISPQRIRAIGYGETRPRVANSSADGRARNRRVSFVLGVEADG